jgi:hypothetical protein
MGPAPRPYGGGPCLATMLRVLQVLALAADIDALAAEDP